VLRITEAAVLAPTVPTHLETSPVPVLEDTTATDSTAQVRLRHRFFLSPHVMRRHYRLLFVVGHAFNEINEVRQQISRGQVDRRGRNLARC